MTISNVANGLRSGVCTSTTRPTAPYEGQMIYETDTNRVLVWDNAAWVMIADTDTPPGLQLIKAQAVGSTPVSFVTITDVFSSEFDNYLVTYAGGTMSVDTAIGMQVGTATSGYYGVFNYTTWGSSTAQAVTDNNNSKWTYAGGRGQMCATVLSPNLARQTVIQSNSTYSNTAGSFTGVEGSNTQHTQVVVLPVSGTIVNGTVRVYGYRN